MSDPMFAYYGHYLYDSDDRTLPDYSESAPLASPINGPHPGQACRCSNHEEEKAIDEQFDFPLPPGAGNHSHGYQQLAGPAPTEPTLDQQLSQLRLHDVRPAPPHQDSRPAACWICSPSTHRSPYPVTERLFGNVQAQAQHQNVTSMSYEQRLRYFIYQELVGPPSSDQLCSMCLFQAHHLQTKDAAATTATPPSLASFTTMSTEYNLLESMGARWIYDPNRGSHIAAFEYPGPNGI